MTRMGMDADGVENSGRQLKAHAAGIGNLAAQLDKIVSALPSVWQGADAQSFVNDWWPQHRKALVAAQQQVDGLGQSALNNASEQRKVSASSGASSGTSAVAAAAGGGLPNPGDVYRDAMGQSALGPITVGTALGMTPLGKVTPYTDDAALALDDRVSVPAKLIGEGSSLTDMGGQKMRDSAIDSGDLPLYLGGVAVSQWSDVANQASQADFSASTFATAKNYALSDPGGALAAAGGAVLNYLPKMFSNWK
jgi:uncharacterized protein YukE